MENRDVKTVAVPIFYFLYFLFLFLSTKDKETFKKDYKEVCKIVYYDTSLQFEL